MATYNDKGSPFPESVRPKRQIRPPAYLSDYQVNVTGQRERSSSHTENMTAQTTFRQKDEYSTESDRNGKTTFSVSQTSTRPVSQRSERDEWGAFYAELEDIQEQLGSDTQLIRSLRDRVRQHVLSRCCGSVEKTSYADTPSLLKDLPSLRQPLLKSAYFASQTSSVSSAESQLATQLMPSQLKTTMEVNPPPPEVESWPEPPPPVCDDSPYTAKVERGFPVSYTTCLSFSNPVKLVAERALAQPYYGSYAPDCVNSKQKPLFIPFKGDFWPHSGAQDVHDPVSPPNHSFIGSQSQPPSLIPHLAPCPAITPPQQRSCYASRLPPKTEPWFPHSGIPYGHPPPLYYEKSPQPLPAQEKVYVGPKPRIPMLIHRDPSEFARLKMSLDNLLPADATELFKYQILVDHLKLDEATLIADSYLNSATPYTDTMTALNEKFGQPHQLALKRIAQVMDSPDIRRGDHEAFQRFALQIRALVGMLETLGQEGEVELKCGSHVARLLSKLPPELRADFRRHLYHQPDSVYTLPEFSKWLQYESWCQGHSELPTKTNPESHTKPIRRIRPATILH